MANVDYALEVFQDHLSRSGLSSLTGMTCLELGPGDSLTSALLAKGAGASQTFLVDAGSFAQVEVEVYRRQVSAMVAAGLDCPSIDGVQTSDEMLSQMNAQYLVDGLASLRNIPDNSVDFVWSQAVLEHVRVGEFDDTLVELHRVMKVGSVASHRVDLQDHLDHSLHNLRFSTEFWERDWWANSGFYTNRLRRAEILRRMGDAGFSIVEVCSDRFLNLPIPRNKMAPEFRDLDDEELGVRGFNVLLKKNGEAHEQAIG